MTNGTPATSKNDLADFLDSIFGTAIQRTSYLIKTYGSLYSLPSLSREWPVDPLVFVHATKTVNFVIIALYDTARQFLIVHSTTELGPEGLVGWRLLGGPIYDHRLESIEEAANRIVKHEVGVDIAELEPIAIVRNKFAFDGKTIEHIGLAFIARAAGEMERPNYTQYKFTLDPPDQMVFLNREVFLLAAGKLGQKYFEPPFEEVISASRPWPVRAFHRVVFKPLTYFLASKPLKKKIRSFILEPKSVLDAAAGDDEFILEIAKELGPDISVANDISWRQMAPLRKNAKARALNIIFTNHNAAELPFVIQFDIVLFKNTLHHARNKDELLAILARLRSISKRLIIVDIENPKLAYVSRLFNLYYSHVYGDGDEYHHFFTGHQFRKLVRLAFPAPYRTTFAKIHTIKGTYMIAVVDSGDIGGC